MTDDERESENPTAAEELADAVSELGATDEERLETVAERNDSLEERLPGPEDLPRTEGSPAEG